MNEPMNVGINERIMIWCYGQYFISALRFSSEQTEVLQRDHPQPPSPLTWGRRRIHRLHQGYPDYWQVSVQLHHNFGPWQISWNVIFRLLVGSSLYLYFYFWKFFLIQFPIFKRGFLLLNMSNLGPNLKPTKIKFFLNPYKIFPNQ